MRTKVQNTLYKSVFLVATLCLFQGCIAIHSSSQKSFVNLNGSNLNTINGTYGNLSADTAFCTDKPLWSLLNFRALYLRRDTLVDFASYAVELHVIDSTRIVAKLWDGKTLLQTKEVKGKIKNNCFSIRRQVRIIGIPFLFFFTADYKTQLGFDSNGNLILDLAENRFGNIIFMAAGNRFRCDYKFVKIHTANIAPLR